MKKILCVLLCALMLLGVLVSCGGDETPDPAVTTTGADNGGTNAPNPDNTGNNPSGGTTATPPAGNTTTTLNPSIGAPKTSPTHERQDFGDALGNARVYTMLVRKGRWNYLHGSEDSTATVQKAVYKRNKLLNEMYNIDIRVAEDAVGHFSEGAASFNTMLSTSTGEYDVAVPDYWWGVEYAGHFENIMTLQEINDADEWWVQGWNNNMIINNRMYTIVGDAALEIFENIELLFFNKTIEEEYDYDLYGTVSEGKWTVDEMIYTIDVFTDALTDNDPDNDVYGAMYDSSAVQGQLYSVGITLF